MLPHPATQTISYYAFGSLAMPVFAVCTTSGLEMHDVATILLLLVHPSSGVVRCLVLCGSGGLAGSSSPVLCNGIRYASLDLIGGLPEGVPSCLQVITLRPFGSRA